MSDLAKYLLLVVAFAALVTTHLTIVVGLALHEKRRARALAALVVPPLAPYWGARARMLGRTAVWCASAAAYAVGWILAR